MKQAARRDMSMYGSSTSVAQVTAEAGYETARSLRLYLVEALRGQGGSGHSVGHSNNQAARFVLNVWPSPPTSDQLWLTPHEKASSEEAARFVLNM